MNQNPLVVDTRSAWDHLSTLIRNGGISWLLGCAAHGKLMRRRSSALGRSGCVWQLRSNYHKRWMTCSECLAAQAFPVWPRFFKNLALCSFAVQNRERPPRSAAVGQAGNAMHCHVCGVILLYALTQVPRVVEPQGRLQQLGFRLFRDL